MFTKSRIFILILTLTCFVVWLASDLIKTPPSFTPDEATTKALLPLTPDFDQNTLNLVSKSNPTLPPFTERATPRPLVPSPPPAPIQSGPSGGFAPSPSPTPQTASPSSLLIP